MSVMHQFWVMAMEPNHALHVTRCIQSILTLTIMVLASSSWARLSTNGSR
jgi:hypothetical protein